MDTEIWKPIPGYEGWYEASSWGRIRAIQRPVKGGPRCFNETYPLTLTPLKWRKGYLKNALGECGGPRPRRREFVHRLVFTAFHGPIPPGLTVNHIDGITNNNRPENLELATHAQQHAHARRLGLAKNMNGQPVHLTEDDIREIRKSYATGQETYESLAARFRTVKSNIRWIIRRRTWQHVQ